MSDLASEVFADVDRVLFVHAHPDDETLSTGALIAHLGSQGVTCQLVTMTRGERGEIVPGPLSGLTGDAFAHRRVAELGRAIAALGVVGHAFLGSPPARVMGQSRRVYSDSGMRWISEGVAGPSGDAGPDSLTEADPEEAARDLVAAVMMLDPELLVTYDVSGSYGHPDHVRTHEIVKRVSELTGVPMVEVLSDPDTDGEWLDLRDELPTVVEALTAHASQVVVDGEDVIHAGGQREPITLTIGVRRVT